MMRSMIPAVACAIAGIAMAGGTAHAQSTVTPRTSPEKPQIRVERMMRAFGGGSYLGVVPSDVSEEQAKTLGLSDPYGAVLDDVVDNTPAKGAGLQKGDVVVSWNGTRVESAAQLRRMVAETPAGRTVRIGYIRAGSRLEAEAKIAEHPHPMGGMNGIISDSMMRMGPWTNFKMGDMKMFCDTTKSKELGKMMEQMREHLGKNGGRMMMMVNGNNGRMGVTLQNLTPQLAKYFGVSDGSGALVGSVAEKSAAADAGLQAGDIVLEIDGQKVATPGDAVRIVSGKPKGDVQVKVLRDKQERTFTVTLKEKAAPSNLDHQMDINGLFAPFENGEAQIELFNAPEGMLRDFQEFPNGDYLQEEEEIETPQTEGDGFSDPNLGSLIPPEPPSADAPNVRTPAPPAVPRVRMFRHSFPMPPTPPTPPDAPAALGI